MKNINIKILAILIGVLCMATNCENENCHRTIPFVNNSEKSLYVMATSYYPPKDTIFRGLGNPTNAESYYKVLPYSSSLSVMLTDGCYEGRSHTKVYIFDAQILETTPWDTVGKYYMILRRYDLTLENLKELNWEVPYPPTEAMKNMKMYPPYEE